MDPKLAEIYGTNQPTEADLEKMAAQKLAEGMSEEEGDEELDLNNLSEEQLEALAQEVLATDGEGAVEEGEDDQSQEKLAEADYLGRVMAHAYVQELRKVAEEAPASEAPAAEEKKPGFLRRGVSATGRGLKTVGGHVAAHKKKYIGGAALAALTAARLGGMGGRVKGYAKKPEGYVKGKYESYRAPSRGEVVGEKAKAGSANLSAMDALVLARVNEILEQNGVDPETLNKTASAGDVLASEVEGRAWATLKEMGLAE